jgi:hypothetical protein
MRLVLSRKQMFAIVGARPYTVQRAGDRRAQGRADHRDQAGRGLQHVDFRGLDRILDAPDADAPRDLRITLDKVAMLSA